MNDRQLDIAVARLSGLDVLGEAPCWQSQETGSWHASWDEDGPDDVPQHVYLAHCCCEHRELTDVVRLGHIAGCLEVVPFYHRDANLAVAALEQICDERHLVAEPYRVPSGDWVVELSRSSGDYEPVAYGRDRSFPLAVVKALVELENEK